MNYPHETRILAVDDSPDNLFLLESLLSEVDEYETQLAEDGKTALKLIEQSPPDVILLDVMMPDINGYEVARRIREAPHLPYIPILLLTAHDQSNLVEGLDAGADDFLRKPFDVDELLARVRAMVRLKRSIDEHRYMVKQRDDFVARLTHDLRTPLVAANRVLEFCLEGTFGDIAEEAQTALANIISNNTNLLTMVNTLLEVYRHDAGQKLLGTSKFSLRSLSEEIVQELVPLAEAKGLDLKLEMQGKNRALSSDADYQPYLIEGDRMELRRLITNLIGNAIKFTDAGHVKVRLQAETSAPTRSQPNRTINLEVEDTGPGISDEDLRQIFEWFRQGDHMRAGSGLGLHLAQRIAQLHGGQITAQSTPGQGSIFTLTLPQSSAFKPATVHKQTVG